MAKRYVKRNQSGDIVGSSRLPKPDIAEEIDDESQEYLDWLIAMEAPGPDTRPSKGQSNGNSIPQLRADIDAIWQALEDAGIVKP
jgi:hypothetical protein